MNSEGGFLSIDERISTFINSLPVLSKDDIDIEDSCPICLTSFEDILQDSESGITKLDCHIFCRKDLVEWIRNLHGSCPTCRYEFLDIHPPSDDESSDGGEYIPNEDDEDEEDAFIDTSDGFTDGDFDTEDMDVDLEDIWERSDGEEMEIRAESEPSSEGDNSMDDQEVVEVNVSILEGDDQEYSSDEAQAEEPK
ncbi:hypothetical protein B0H19DRAFT_1178225 [Mycena capillaripes]|nr:hypothetical protein B0H19DRAFT_1204418 [Mycena capillaripes]KAJ6539295.1 hypothetical protein B0H19DRAFT_1178225 [Mycena capillaripes]